jgi:elongation factor Tu
MLRLQSMVLLVWALFSGISGMAYASDEPAEAPFLMPIEDIFSITGRGTVVTGRIERGVIRIGASVELVGLGDTQSTTVTGVEMFRKQLDSAMAGDNVGLVLKDVAKADVQRGMVLATPATVQAHSQFSAEVYLLTKDEGGRQTPVFTGYQPQFVVRTGEVTGTMTLAEGAPMLMPGDKTTVSIQLIEPIALDTATTFVIREGGRTVGSGTVGKITK